MKRLFCVSEVYKPISFFRQNARVVIGRPGDLVPQNGRRLLNSKEQGTGVQKGGLTVVIADLLRHASVKHGLLWLQTNINHPFQETCGLRKLKTNRQSDDKVIDFSFFLSLFQRDISDTLVHVYGITDKSWLAEKEIKRSAWMISIVVCVCDSFRVQRAIWDDVTLSTGSRTTSESHQKLASIRIYNPYGNIWINDTSYLRIVQDELSNPKATYVRAGQHWFRKIFVLKRRSPLTSLPRKLRKIMKHLS